MLFFKFSFTHHDGTKLEEAPLIPDYGRSWSIEKS